MKVKSYINRCDVPDNDTELLNKEDVIKALKTLKYSCELDAEEAEACNNDSTGYRSCAEQINHLIQDVVGNE